MKNIYLVTVSDDRSKRKKGKYGITQKMITEYFKENDIGLTKHFAYTWNDIYQSDFYKKNSNLLKWINPDINGRAYKPYVILETLNKINSNDFIIYNDCSPEHWHFANKKFTTKKLPKEIIDLNNIIELCEKNKDLLTVYVGGNYSKIKDENWRGGHGNHTHERMTSPTCLKYMKCEQYKNYLQHAGGMMVIKKTEKNINFVKEWLHYNTIKECCSLADYDYIEKYEKDSIINHCEFKESKGTLIYWTDGLKENPKLAGHRHDQSISGLLLNKLNHKLINPLSNIIFSKWNFLEYCRKDLKYEFIAPDPNSQIIKINIPRLKNNFNDKEELLISYCENKKNHILKATLTQQQKVFYITEIKKYFKQEYNKLKEELDKNILQEENLNDKSIL